MKKSNKKMKRRNPVARTLFRYTAGGPMGPGKGEKGHRRVQRRDWKVKLRKKDSENL